MSAGIGNEVADFCRAAGVPGTAAWHAARAMLDRAARHALRGWGRVEPNPLVGCVIAQVAGSPAGPRVLAIGHHRVFGGLHAEAEALSAARAHGHARLGGAVAFVTLEPCDHTGKQPPCTRALIDAGVGGVVYARADPHPPAAGGAGTLERAGVACVLSAASPPATALSDPFVHRVRTGRPWVIAKWAQTLDGKAATRTGESRWISNPRSRRWVHLMRARVDAVMVGIGTTRDDDPALDARDVPVRRRALRVVVDPSMALSPQGRLARDAGAGRATVVCVTCEHARAGAEAGDGPAGVVELRVANVGGLMDLNEALTRLRAEHGVQTILVEGGPGLLGRLLAEGPADAGGSLIDEAHVFTAPMVMGDDGARDAVRGVPARPLADLSRWRLMRLSRVGDDVWSVYRRPMAT